ncbi:hypothetical protein Bca101_061111 [Brassica carinata]
MQHDEEEEVAELEEMQTHEVESVDLYLLIKSALSREHHSPNFVSAFIWFVSCRRSLELKSSLENPESFKTLISEATKCPLYIGRENAYVRFSCNTVGVVGVNMVSISLHNVLDFLTDAFPDMDVIGISGEFLLYLFSDKKPAAVNWIEGHGKSIFSDTHARHRPTFTIWAPSSTTNKVGPYDEGKLNLNLVLGFEDQSDTVTLMCKVFVKISVGEESQRRSRNLKFSSIV